MTINPRELIPVDDRIKRAKKGFGRTYQFRSRLPRHYELYKFAQIPSTETELTAGYTSGHDSLFFSNGTVRAYGDILMMNGELFVTGKHDKVTNARIYLGRSDPDGGLLGPLNATRYALGDVSATAVPLVSHSMAGRGLRVSSRPKSYVAEFDRITIEGDLPDGYDVELYRNSILIDAQRRGEGQAGRYRFSNVQLFRGTNNIRVEFYGPQGQRRTETRAYNVGGARVSVGKVYYDVSAHEAGRSVFGFDDRKERYPDGRFGGAARFDYGYSRDISLTGGIVAAPVPRRKRRGGTTVADDDEYRYYATTGLRTQYDGVAIVADSAFDHTGGAALGLGAQMAVDHWNLSFRQEGFFNDFRSDASAHSLDDPDDQIDRTRHFKESETRIDARRAFLVDPGMHFALGLGGTYTKFRKDDQWSIQKSLDVSAGLVSAGNTLSYNGGSKYDASDLEGSARLNLRLIDKVSFRGSVSYGIGGDRSGVHSFSVGLSTLLPLETNFSTGYARNLAYGLNEYDNENFYASLRRDFGWATLGLLGSYSRHQDPDIEDGATIALTASFSTFTDPKTFKTDVTSERIARQGAIRVAAFHDKNNNGVRDAGETNVRDAKILIAGARKPYYTGDGNKKIAKAAKVRSGGWMDLAIMKGGLPAGDLSPGNKGAAVLPRPGVVTEVALPVSSTADIEGAVYLGRGDNERAMPNVTVQVVRVGPDGKGQVVAEAATEFDGVFAIATVPVGTYNLRIDPEQAKRIGIERPVVGDIELKSETGVIEGLKISLNRETSVATLQISETKE